MKDDYIEFKKQRELGEILSDTFAFLRSQFKPFFATYFKIVGPYLVVMLIASGFYLYSFQPFFDIGSEPSDQIFGGAVMVLSLFVFLISLVLVYSISQSTTLHYIKSYANNKGSIDLAEIKREVYATLWSFIGLGFLVVLSIIAGFMACIIPGVYLYVPLVLSFSVLVFDQKGATDAYGYSFTLIKDEWWITFATLLVIGIIVGIASYAFNIPAAIYSWMKMGIFSGELDAETMTGNFVDPIYILLNVLSTLASLLLNLISVIAAAFVYFNLNEKKNFTGTYERIQNLGKTPEN